MNNNKYSVDWYFGWIKVFENMIFDIDILNGFFFSSIQFVWIILIGYAYPVDNT